MLSRETKMLRLLALFPILHIGLCGNEDLIVTVENRVNLLGNNVTFRCLVQRNMSDGLRMIDGPEDIEWTFLRVASSVPVVILNSDEKNRTEDGVSGTSSDSKSDFKYHKEVWPDITIHATTEADAGSYTCKLMKTGQTATAQLYIIDTFPVCTKSNDGPIYYENDIVTLTCTMGFHGNQKPKLDWKLPEYHVDYEHLKFKEENSVNLISSSVTLSLQHMIDGKTFTCYSSFVNTSSEPYNCTTMFQPESVLYPPYISHMRTFPYTKEHNRQVNEGSNLTLACEAHGNPKPTWTWKFFPNKVNKSRLLPCKLVTCPLKHLTGIDTGSYQCTVTNTVKGVNRTATQTLYIKVNGKGPFPTGAPVNVEYKKEKGFSPYAIGAIVCASLAVILIIIFILLALKMRRREHLLHERMTRMGDENFDDQEVELLDENIQPDNTELPAEYGRLKQQWEIARKDIRLVDLIAKGSFVEVWRGRMRKYPRRNEIMKVAIKRIVSEATEKERRFYLAELEVMKAIQPHPNVLPLIGCYTGSDPWLIMVEYAVEGSLYQYLQHRRPGDLRVEISTDNHDSVSLRNQNLTAHKLLSLAAQVVNGLIHINRFKMIFYRLRASSVLVCKGGVCKLSGFGFTQDITERNLYEGNSSPVRWMSPESLFENVFNIKTDIWSFGILLWEIVHFGHLPYPDMGPHEVTEKIQTGYRMSQPPHCSSDIYNLMLMCWAENPENRPCFGDIMQNLHHLTQQADTHIVIDKLPDGLRSADIIDNTESIA